MTAIDPLDIALIVAAFVTRTAALVLLIILARLFMRSHGPMMRPFKELFFSLAFLLAWVWVASVAELVGYIRNAHAVVEYGANWIFIPNLVITFGLARLLWHLDRRGR